MEQTKKGLFQNLDKDKTLALVVLIFMGLVSFGLGGPNYSYILEALGFIAAIAILAFTNIKKDESEKKKLLFYGIPLIIFAIFGSFSKYWLQGSWSNFSLCLINAIGILAFFFVGYLSKDIKYLSLRNLLFPILIGLALLVFIASLYQLINYGFFYSVRYAGKVRYYDGTAVTVSNEYAALWGFSIISVSLQYGLQYAFILAASLISLLFVSYKEDKALFLTIAICGGLGLLALILVPYKLGLLLLIPLLVLGLLLKFVKFPQKTPRWEVILSWCVLGVGVVFLGLVFVNGINQISAFNQGALGKIFNNGRYMVAVNEIIQLVMTKTVSTGGSTFRQLNLAGLFGVSYYAEGEWLGAKTNINSLAQNHIFEFSVLYEGGLLAFLALCVALVFAIISLRKFIHSDEKISGAKMAVVLLLAAWFWFESTACDVSPYSYLDANQYYVYPTFNNAFFMIVMLLLGASYTPIFGLKAKKLEDEDND